MEQNSESDHRLLPSYILSTRSVLNPINQDLNSFGHAIVFAYHPTDWNARREQPAKEKRLIKHGLDKIKYPVLPCEVPKLENQLRMRINHFSFDDPSGYRRYAMYISISKSDFLEVNQSFLLGWTICLDKTFFSTVLRYNEVCFL